MSSPHPPDQFNEVESTVEALQSLGDEAMLPSYVLEFAHFLGNRLRGSDVKPSDFLLASSFAISDLRIGIDGYTKEPIESGAARLNDLAYHEMLNSIPTLARIAFSTEFGDEVQKKMEEIGMINEPIIETDKPSLSAGEIITQEIITMEEAHQLIIEDARQRVTALDWSHFDIDSAKVSDEFRGMYPLVLQRAPFFPPINLLTDKPDKEADILVMLPDDQKMQLSDSIYWIGIVEPITPKTATLTRDHLFLKCIEPIAQLNHIEPEDAFKYFMGDDADGSFGRAVIRLAQLGLA